MHAESTRQDTKEMQSPDEREALKGKKKSELWPKNVIKASTQAKEETSRII